MQWGGTHVFKVGGKIFAMANGLVDRRASGYMFKASDMAYELLIEHGLARPAPYLARAKWVQLTDNDILPDAELAAYLDQAHALIAANGPGGAADWLANEVAGGEFKPYSVRTHAQAQGAADQCRNRETVENPNRNFVELPRSVSVCF